MQTQEKADHRSYTAAEKGAAASDASETTSVFAALVAEEDGHDIKYRTLSWQKATLLLFGEYVCLAILALPWSFSVLGWVVGLIVQIGIGLITWYTSYVLWQYQMRHPECRDICDIAARLFPRWSRLAYEATAVMLLLNNIFVIGFHVFTGAKILNTLDDSKMCNVVFQVVSAIIGVIVSLPRTLNHVSLMSVVSASCMGIAILLSLVYVGIEPHPGTGYGKNGTYPGLGEVRTAAGIPGGGVSFVDGVNAMLNITFLWIGQILYPSFIAEMREPRDFPKALAALTLLEMILFTIVSVVGYHYLGQYATAPMMGSLANTKYKKSAFAFVLVPTVVIGAIYSNVAAKYVYNRILGPNSRHTYTHTVVGWGTWVGIVVAIWAIGFVLGNVIPSMGDFLSIMSGAFDSFFGFFFWAVAYYHLNRGKLFSSASKTAQSIFNVFIFGIGLFMLGPGLYTSIKAIILDYAGPTRKPFSCTPVAI
ncbi:hypothetical protein VHUM_01350 [Vanrija humicola]|uniref:Amino acid transporter transmembrane domain-containing protein n=1 Tax=Vanrija humicola TaxID=5417 RepID=A0A7D8Z1U1_VANHU|nr:hypothetical protein VHUM_01350 [Vanrija humicola]